MSGFDTVLIVDWSGGNDRGAKPKKDAIWAGVNRGGVVDVPVYLRNRQIAEDWLAAFFQAELDAGRRVFAGFDFPFGYPDGFAQAVTGSKNPLALWDWFETQIKDASDANNRFDIAGQINEALGGRGPFWANGLSRDIAGLPRTKKDYNNPFADRRTCEEGAKGTFTCWQMAGAGSVGGQVFMGLPVLSRLRKRFALHVAVWPFEAPDVPIVFVEIWPSLTVGPGPEGMIKDSWQVAELARQISNLSLEQMAKALDVVAPVEGSIFGLGYEDLLQLGPPPLRNDCFALPAGVEWTSVDEALELLKARMSPVTDVETVLLDGALQRIAAVDVFAPRANPPLPNTAVDGYGFAGARGPGLHRMALIDGQAAAGDAPGNVLKDRAIRILTGAALPTGVDTVVLQEDVTVTAGEIQFYGPVKQGSNTRKAGEDVTAGQQVLSAGQRITPADIALLAATGVAELAVRKQLRVGVLSTGDELVRPGSDAALGQIFDANRPMLIGLLTQFGYEVVDLGQAPDDRAALRTILDNGAGQVDAILTSGGASAGDKDHMAALLNEVGAMALWRIAIKPGRPLALGIWNGTPVFGLPGNPVAAMVCSLVFAVPALTVLAGGTWKEPQGFMVPAAFNKHKKAGRREFLRARIRNGQAEAFASEGSGRISGLSWADGLVELPDEAAEIKEGDLVRYIPYASFGS